MMKSVLLTGGTGYIGSHIAVELLNEGRDVVIVDNLSNSRSDVVDRIEIITGRRPRFYETDAADSVAMEQVFTENDIGTVIHLAGYKAVGESVKIPVTYYRNNLDTILTVLETMIHHHCKQLVFSSSATVYGTGNPCPLTEEMPTGNCSNPYGWTKYMIERILTDAAGADPSLSVILLRYFNPVGAHESGLIGEQPNEVPNNLMPYMTAVAAGVLEELHVFGDNYPTRDGTGVRDYIHVTDLAKGHLAALKYAETHCGVEAINLGTGIGYSVLELIRTFEEVNKVAVPYRITERREGDLAECYASVEKAHRLLGWRTEKNLKDMCRDSWHWEKRNRTWQ